MPAGDLGSTAASVHFKGFTFAWFVSVSGESVFLNLLPQCIGGSLNLQVVFYCAEMSCLLVLSQCVGGPLCLQASC